MTAANHMQSRWTGRMGFVFAAAGSAVGLGNIWKFPYILGESGGGAFMLIYLACLLLIAAPILLSEILLGKRAHANPITGMQKLSRRNQVSQLWQVIGWLGVLTGFMILSFYVVVMGWSLAYTVEALRGGFVQTDAEQVGGFFSSLQERPGLILFWMSVAMFMTVAIVALGVNRGIERATRLMVPLLVVLLVILAVLNINTDGFSQAIHFMFAPDFSQVTAQTVLVALGHAFFTLSLGMGAIMAYGAYLPEKTSLAQVAGWVLLLDTGIAVLAGIVIFPLVYSHGLSPEEGAGLVFLTLPLALESFYWPYLLGVLLFGLVSVAAWTSSISLLEPTTAYMEQRFGLKRVIGAVSVGFVIWCLGVLAALSFNVLAPATVFGMSIFDFLAFISTSFMLPLGGMLLSLFAVWKLSREESFGHLGLAPWAYQTWRVLAGVVAPVCVVLIFIASLGLFGLSL